jgi:hypothetical protein
MTPINSYTKYVQAQLTGSAVALYTCPANATARVKSITLYNTDASNPFIPTLQRVANNAGAVGTPAATDTFHKISLAATTRLTIADPGIVLTAENDTIQGLADTTAKINVFIELEVWKN